MTSNFSSLSFSSKSVEPTVKPRKRSDSLTLETLGGHGIEGTIEKPKAESYSKVLLLGMNRVQAQVTSLSKDLQELKSILHEIHRSI